MNETLAPKIPETLTRAIRETEELCRRLPEIGTSLSAIADRCAESLCQGGTLYFCGNGGLAAESQHLATEFVVRLSAKRNRGALSAIALSTDTSLLTACSNDYGFEHIFERQVEAHMNKGDVLLLLSTSGQSPNLLLAAKAARALGGIVVALEGEAETPLDALADLALHIPSGSGQRVQEGHLLCGHLLVELIEDRLLGEAGAAR